MSEVYQRREASTNIGKKLVSTGVRQVELHKPGWRTRALWTLAYGVGGTVGAIASTAIPEFFFPDHSGVLGLSTPLPQLMAALLGVFTMGAFIGLATWLVLRRYIMNSLAWIPLSGAGTALGSVLATVILPLVWPTSALVNIYGDVDVVRSATPALIIGLLLGSTQATLLIRRVSDTGGVLTFVVTSGLGWLGLDFVGSMLSTATQTMAGLGLVRDIVILFPSFVVAGIISSIEFVPLLKKHQQQFVEETTSHVYTPIARAD